MTINTNIGECFKDYRITIDTWSGALIPWKFGAIFMEFSCVCCKSMILLLTDFLTCLKTSLATLIFSPITWTWAPLWGYSEKKNQLLCILCIAKNDKKEMNKPAITQQSCYLRKFKRRLFEGREYEKFRFILN
jgi:hypothetical protein